jgi:hypothetical protein
MPHMSRSSRLHLQGIIKAVDNVPFRIGARELKEYLFAAILDHWNLFSKNFPLSMEDIMMCNSNWAHLLPIQPDVNAITRYFLKGAKGKFRPGKCQIFFHVSNEYYACCLQHKETTNLNMVQLHLLGTKDLTDYNPRKSPSI